MALFEIRDLSFSYPNEERKVLDSVSFRAEKGEFILLFGESGSGKTTLLRHLKTVLAPHGIRSGEILLDGKPLDEVSLAEQARRVGFVTQDPDQQIVTDKVWHELAFGLENLGCDPVTMRLRVAEMASYFGIQGWFERDTSELSGGQKQLLNLAGVMAMQPEALILDEPTSQLDPIAASDFLNTLRKLNRDLGTTVIITEHRIEELFQFADRVVMLEDGKVSADGTPREACADMYEKKSPLCGALPAPIRVHYESGAKGECPLTVREGRKALSERIADPKTRELPPRPRPDMTERAVRLKEVWFRYERDGADVLKGLTADIPRGCLYAVAGGNGAGKSTMLRALSGICKPYRGSIELLGRPIKSYRRGELFRNGVTMLPQDPHCLFVKRTVGEDLLEMTDDRGAIARVAELCEVGKLLSRHPRDLSGGEIQRAALAKVLLTKPRLLMADEPTKGMDSGFKRRFAELMRELTAQGVTVLMVSHDTEFCAEYADMTAMFFDGQIITADTPERFFGANSFYTTAASRMSRHLFTNAVTAREVAELIQRNEGGEA